MFEESARVSIFALVVQWECADSETVDIVTELFETFPQLGEAVWGTLPGDPEWKSKRVQDWFLRGFLTMYLEELEARGLLDSHVVHAETFNDVFNESMELLASKVIIVRRIIPLTNLELNHGDVEFERGITLRTARLDEVERWMNGGVGSILGFGARFNSRHLPFVKAALEIHTPRGRLSPQGTEYEKAEKSLEAALSAVRLATNSGIYPLFTEIFDRSALATSYAITYGPESTPLLSPHLLVSEEAQIMKEIFPKMRRAARRGRLAIALRRWQDSFERGQSEDRFIDVWIGLEALFGDRGGETTLRLALRIAAFLGETPNERTNLYEQLKKSYDFRSVIVHGDIPGSAEDVEYRAGEARNWLREAILQVLHIRDFDPSRIETALLQGTATKGAPLLASEE